MTRLFVTSSPILATTTNLFFSSQKKVKKKTIFAPADSKKSDLTLHVDKPG